MPTNQKPSSHSRLETREGQQRPINKDYYYVDFHATIDAIKYRIFRLTQKVQDMYKPSEEKKDFYCPRCKARWTELEVVDKPCPMGFLCHRCDGLLEREPDVGDSTGHAKQSRLTTSILLCRSPFLWIGIRTSTHCSKGCLSTLQILLQLR